MSESESRPASTGRRGSCARGVLLGLLGLAGITLLAGIAIFNFGGLGEEGQRPQRTKSRLRQVGAAIQNYRDAHGRLPSNLGELVGKPDSQLTARALQDGWREAWIYAPTPVGAGGGREFTLRSCGPDRFPGTADDIDFWDLEEVD